jgi:hypothetical protein
MRGLVGSVGFVGQQVAVVVVDAGVYKDVLSIVGVDSIAPSQAE